MLSFLDFLFNEVNTVEEAKKNSKIVNYTKMISNLEGNNSSKLSNSSLQDTVGVAHQLQSITLPTDLLLMTDAPVMAHSQPTESQINSINNINTSNLVHLSINSNYSNNSTNSQIFDSFGNNARLSNNNTITTNNNNNNNRHFSYEFQDEQEQCLQLFEKWSPVEQIEFTENLLRRMCHFQHGHINNFLKPMLQRDFISSLPGNLN